VIATFSFGYCEKQENFKLKPIGQYGNGFKSGSMRIGKDAIVFTKEVNTMSVGLLSQTYLEVIDADTIYLPIVTFDKKTNILCW
jgi:MORC family CW-type zinc finger protein